MKRAILLVLVAASTACAPAYQEFRGDMDGCSGDFDINAEAFLLFDRPGDPQGWFGYEVAGGTYLSGGISDLEEDGAGIRFEVQWEDQDMTGLADFERDGEDLEGEIELERGNNDATCDVELRLRS